MQNCNLAVLHVEFMEDANKNIKNQMGLKG